MLDGKRIVLGVTGGVAAYKAAALVRELQRAGVARVQVVMTEAATHFVGPTTFQALSGQPVFTDALDPRIPDNMAHIELSRAADAIVIAPATADFLARLAQGRADDLLSALCLARECPLMVAPAMNRQMWTNAATQRNVTQLMADDVAILGPDRGDQACGETGPGRMLEPAALVEEIAAQLAPKLLAGRRALLTAGPTFEPIDPVRGLTNRSSGKMGFALARALRAAGADVVLVAGPVHLPTPLAVHRVDVGSAQEMHDAVMTELDAAADAGTPFDLFVGVAAVADWRIVDASAHKCKKIPGAPPPVLELGENPDILAAVARRADAPYCIGFAAESENLEENAVAKRQRKNVPLLIANLGPATFGRDDNELLLVDENGSYPLPRAGKEALGHALAAEFARRLAR